MATEKIEEISKITNSMKASATDADMTVAQEDLVREAPNREKFQSLLDTEQAKEKATVLRAEQANETGKKPTLFDEVRDIQTKADQVRKGTAKDLVAQAQEVIAKMDDVKSRLQTQDLEIGKSTRSLMQNRLDHIDDNLRAAMDKMGVEYKSAPRVDPSTLSPIERYLGLLTNSQHNLQTLARDASWLAKNDKEFNPASMLRIQIKVGFVQQELEFFTSLLNKALESTKTIMNVQV